LVLWPLTRKLPSATCGHDRGRSWTRPRIFGRVTAAVIAAGRKPRGRAVDLMIAASAIAEGLPLYTTNPADFTGLDALIRIHRGHQAACPPRTANSLTQPPAWLSLALWIPVAQAGSPACFVRGVVLEVGLGGGAAAGRPGAGRVPDLGTGAGA
jgi:hypothetical protein